MGKYLPLFLLISILIWPYDEAGFDYSFQKPDVKSAFGTKEDPLARSNYEHRMLANPLTGQIPKDIRKREVAFYKKMSKNAAYLDLAYARKAQTDWQLAGPYNVGGRTRAAGIDILDENTLISGGVSGGIWKSVNAGSEWTRVTDPDTHQGISCLVQDTRSGKESTWYAGTGEQLGNSARATGAVYRGNGILKSTDNGDSWEPIASTQTSSPQTLNTQFQYIWKVLVNKNKTDIDQLLVATYGGILRSQDAGDSWEVVLGESLFDLPEDADLNDTPDPSFTNIIQNEAGHFFASLSAATSVNNIIYSKRGFYFSTDAETWTDITPPSLATLHARTVISAGKSSPGRVYFLVYANNGVSQLWRYTYSIVSGGVPNGSWENLSENIPMLGGNLGDFNAQSGYNMLIAVHPKYPDVVYLGGTNLYRSTDGFITSNNTKWIGGYNPDQSNAHYPSQHADQHLLLFYPSDENKVLSGHDGGLSRSSSILNDSVRYVSLNNGYVTTQFYTISQDRTTTIESMLGGMQDNGAYIRNSPGGNNSWNRLINGDGGYMAIAPNKDFVYAGFQNGLIYRLSLNSVNDITGFARVDPAGAGEDADQGYLFINPFILDPQNPNRMFLTSGDYIWRNYNLLQIPNGSNSKTRKGWETLDDTRLATGIYTSIEKAQDVVYAGIYRQQPTITKITSASVAKGEITTKNMGFSTFPAGGYISCIAAASDNPDILLVTFSNYEIPSIFLSMDGGETFTDVSGNLEEFPDGSGDGPSVRWAEIVPTSSGYDYFVATSTGLFSTALDASSNNTNTIWVQEGAQQMGKSVIAMLDYRPTDGRMVVGTHGNGVFRGFLSPASMDETPEESRLALGQNYPNPVFDETLINFTIPEDDIVRIDLFDAQGNFVRNLLWGMQYAGESTIYWDGTNPRGVKMRAGNYIYRLSYRGKTKSKRLVLLD